MFSSLFSDALAVKPQCKCVFKLLPEFVQRTKYLQLLREIQVHLRQKAKYLYCPRWQKSISLSPGVAILEIMSLALLMEIGLMLSESKGLEFHLAIL